MMPDRIDPDGLARIDHHVQQRWPGRKGFYLRQPEVQAQGCVHARPYLRTAAGDGLLYQSLPLEPLTPTAEYPLVVLKPVTTDLSDGLLAWLHALTKEGRPWVVIESSSSGLHAIVEGRPLALEGRAKPSMTGLALRGVTDRAEPDVVLVPFEVEVASYRSECHFTLELSGADLPEAFSRHVLLRAAAAGTPVGPCRVRVDAAPSVTGPDGFTFTAIAAACPVVLEAVTALPAALVRLEQRPVHLHLLFDRTTIDPRRWTELAAGGRQSQAGSADAQLFDPVTEPVAARAPLNQELRQAASRALQLGLPRLGPDARLSLYWFADVPREGMAVPQGSDVAAAPWGRFGPCAPEALPQRLTSVTFDRVSGIDLHDAVDEALEGLAHQLAAQPESGDRPVVLILGDSPPPPEGPDDPLWRCLDEPVPSSARTARRFRASLARLTRAGIPVGFLFLRDGAGVETLAALSPARALYPAYRTLKEHVVEALGQVEDLTVHAADGIEDLDRAVPALLATLSDQVSALHRPRVKLLPETQVSP